MKRTAKRARRERRPPVGNRCGFCSGSGKQGAACSGDYCTCGGDGHAVTCYWCDGKGTKKAEAEGMARHQAMLDRNKKSAAESDARWARARGGS